MPPNASNGTQSAAIQKDSSENRTGAESVIYSPLSISRPSKVIITNEELRKPIEMRAMLARGCPAGWKRMDLPCPPPIFRGNTF